MLKFKGLILTITISFIPLFVFETNAKKAVALNKPSNTPMILKLSVLLIHWLLLLPIHLKN